MTQKEILQIHQDKLNKSVELFYEGYSPLQISKMLHVSAQKVRNHLKNFGYVDMNIDTGLNVDIFKEIDTEEKAYWLGFLYADGYIRESSIELALKDKEHIEKFKEFTGSRCKISEKHITLKDKQYTAYRISMRNKDFAYWLYDKGMHQNKSLDITYPSCIPNELNKDFIRGYFDGNGCISFLYNNPLKPVITINSTKSMLESIVSIMNLPNNHIRQVSKIHEYRTAKLDSVYNFLYNIYNSSTIYLDRKFQKYCLLAESLSNQ